MKKKKISRKLKYLSSGSEEYRLPGIDTGGISPHFWLFWMALIVAAMILGLLFGGCRFLPGGSYLEEPAWMDVPAAKPDIYGVSPAGTNTALLPQSQIDRHEAEKLKYVNARRP